MAGGASSESRAGRAAAGRGAARGRASPLQLGHYLASPAARRRVAALASRRWLIALWWLLTTMLLAVLIVVTRPSGGEVLRLAPAEDDTPVAVPESLARRVRLAGPDESISSAALSGTSGLHVATGGPSLPLRAAPSIDGEPLVRVPDGAALDDLGEITPDGAWRRVAWEGWEGWIAAGLLRGAP